MEIARHGLAGDLVDLTTFISLEGTEPRKWKVHPICPECGERVHLYDVKGAMGFRETGNEVTNPRAKPGFHHYDNPLDDCPNSFRDDPRFHGFKDVEVDARIKTANEELLRRPDIRAMNATLLRTFMEPLTGLPEVGQEDRGRMYRKAKRWMFGMTVLRAHPWILPYALVLFEDGRTRDFKRPATLVYRDVGTQTLKFTNYEAKERIARIPNQIQLFFQNKGASGFYYNPYKKRGSTEVVFDVSAEAAEKIVRNNHGPSPGFVQKRRDPT